MTRTMASVTIACIWLTAGGLMSPWLVFYKHTVIVTTLQTIPVCHQKWPSSEQERGYFLGAIFLTCYTIPLILISVCYTLIACRVWNRNAPGIANTSGVIYRSKMKVVKMLVVVVILFAFSWLPLYGTLVRMYFGPTLETHPHFHLLSQIVLPIAQWLGSSNSCVNPIIYCFFSKKFRHGFTDMVRCCRGVRRSSSYFHRDTSGYYHSVNNGLNQTVVTSVRSLQRGYPQQHQQTQKQQHQQQHQQHLRFQEKLRSGRQYMEDVSFV